MSQNKVNDLRKDIKYLEAEKAFNVSMIALLLAEGNQIDSQIELHTNAGLAIESKLKDLKAELADTI